MDETGLTGKQKITLLSAWGLIKQDLDLHGRNIMLLIFREHPHFIPYFDFSADPNNTSLSENRALQAHSLNLIMALGALIEYGLKTPKMFECTLAKLVKNHKTRRVTSQDVKMFGEVILMYFAQVLGRQSASSLPTAFNRLIEQIAEAFEAAQFT
ncbi:globin 2 [Culex quinquefasciatus]|uniref:Globin 2 n=1 Tax=Culex quinquefasciatus TaxID=7176 RepID=B0W547_CULQU|nr:globin 2 [Culex quinquefasciatus]|eukprot:XP_001843831.1 globin 2 [Culex quinquefasciatus]